MFVTLVLAFSILIENVIGVVPSSISASDSSSIRFTQAVFPKDMQQNKEAAKTPLARISFSLYYYCGATVFPLSQLYSMNLVLKCGFSRAITGMEKSFTLLDANYQYHA